MRMTMPMMLTVGLLGAVLSSQAAETVTLETLLAEMTDRDSVTYFPKPVWRGRLWSSYDRASVAPDRPGWFANGDFSQFLRTETNAGRTERVLADAEGPGAVTRFWVTVDNVQPDGGTLRIYIDGAREPAFEGTVFRLLSGGGLCPAPLGDSVSPQTQIDKRGHNLYLPLPFAKRCKVTVEYEGTHSFYYNIETRRYAKNTKVESVSPAVLARAAGAIRRANALLAAGTADPLPQDAVRRTRENLAIPPGGQVTETFAGPGALREFVISYREDSWNPRDPRGCDVHVEMTFDGEKTVDVPLTDLFGAGNAPREFMTRNASAVLENKGYRLTSRWTMPFARSATVTLRNNAKSPFGVRQMVVATGKYPWDAARSMHFAVQRGGGRDQPTRDARNDSRDIRHFAVQGRMGVFAGCGVTVLNSARAWWGEGDEKVFVDGEKFPSYFGTGTEDHYGYAWCRPETFSHPFVAQPDGAGNLNPGQSVNMRCRALDTIPFTRSLVFDIELWHWKDCRVGYETVSWAYLRPL